MQQKQKTPPASEEENLAAQTEEVDALMNQQTSFGQLEQADTPVISDPTETELQKSASKFGSPGTGFMQDNFAGNNSQLQDTPRIDQTNDTYMSQEAEQARLDTIIGDKGTQIMEVYLSEPASNLLMSGYFHDMETQQACIQHLKNKMDAGLDQQPPEGYSFEFVGNQPANVQRQQFALAQMQLQQGVNQNQQFQQFLPQIQQQPPQQNQIKHFLSSQDYADMLQSSDNLKLDQHNSTPEVFVDRDSDTIDLIDETDPKQTQYEHQYKMSVLVRSELVDGSLHFRVGLGLGKVRGYAQYAVWKLKECFVTEKEMIDAIVNMTSIKKQNNPIGELATLIPLVISEDLLLQGGIGCQFYIVALKLTLKRILAHLEELVEYDKDWNKALPGFSFYLVIIGLHLARQCMRKGAPNRLLMDQLFPGSLNSDQEWKDQLLKKHDEAVDMLKAANICFKQTPPQNQLGVQGRPKLSPVDEMYWQMTSEQKDHDHLCQDQVNQYICMLRHLFRGIGIIENILAGVQSNQIVANNQNFLRVITNLFIPQNSTKYATVTVEGPRSRDFQMPESLKHIKAWSDGIETWWNDRIPALKKEIAENAAQLDAHHQAYKRGDTRDQTGALDSAVNQAQQKIASSTLEKANKRIFQLQGAYIGLHNSHKAGCAEIKALKEAASSNPDPIGPVEVSKLDLQQAINLKYQHSVIVQSLAKRTVKENLKIQACENHIASLKAGAQARQQEQANLLAKKQSDEQSHRFKKPSVQPSVIEKPPTTIDLDKSSPTQIVKHIIPNQVSEVQYKLEDQEPPTKKQMNYQRHKKFLSGIHPEYLGDQNPGKDSPYFKRRGTNLHVFNPLVRNLQQKQTKQKTKKGSSIRMVSSNWTKESLGTSEVDLKGHSALQQLEKIFVISEKGYLNWSSDGEMLGAQALLLVEQIQKSDLISDKVHFRGLNAAQVLLDQMNEYKEKNPIGRSTESLNQSEENREDEEEDQSTKQAQLLDSKGIDPLNDPDMIEAGQQSIIPHDIQGNVILEPKPLIQHQQPSEEQLSALANQGSQSMIQNNTDGGFECTVEPKDGPISQTPQQFMGHPMSPQVNPRQDTPNATYVGNSQLPLIDPRNCFNQIPQQLISSSQQQMQVQIQQSIAQSQQHAGLNPQQQLQQQSYQNAIDSNPVRQTYSDPRFKNPQKK